MISQPSWRRLFQCSALAIATILAGCQRAEKTPETPVFVAEKLPIDDTLRDRIDRVIDHTLNHRRLNTRDHAAWQIVHALLAFGDDLQIEHDGQLVPAQKWLLDGNRLTGWNLRIGDKGVLIPVEESSKTGQGHPDQWIGYLTQNGLSPEAAVMVEGKPFKVRDILTQAQWDLTQGMEATWLLMAVGHPSYWELDMPWTSRSGETWTVEKLAEMEGKAKVVGGSCGGTHRLYSLAMAVNQKLVVAELEPSQLTGGWKVANDTVESFKKQTRERFQNADGTFSGHYYVRPGAVTDISDRVGTTGHIFEFLVAASSDKVREPWMVAACEKLVSMMEQAKDVSLDCGGMYHAAHGLMLYRARIFGEPTAKK